MSKTGERFIAVLVVFVFIGGIFIFCKGIFGAEEERDYLYYRMRNSMRNSGVGIFLDEKEIIENEVNLRSYLSELNQGFQKLDDDQEDKFIYVADFPEFNAPCLFVYNDKVRKIPLRLDKDGIDIHQKEYCDKIFRGEKP